MILGALSALYRGPVDFAGGVIRRASIFVDHEKARTGACVPAVEFSLTRVGGKFVWRLLSRLLELANAYTERKYTRADLPFYSSAIIYDCVRSYM